MSNKAGQTSLEGEDSEIAKMLTLGTEIGEGEQSTPAPNQPTPGSVQNLVPPGPTEPPDTTERVPPGPTVPPDTTERVPPGPTVPPDPTDQVLPGPTVPPDPTDQAAARAGTSRDSWASRAAPASPATQHEKVNISESDKNLPNDKKSLANVKKNRFSVKPGQPAAAPEVGDSADASHPDLQQGASSRASQPLHRKSGDSANASHPGLQQPTVQPRRWLWAQPGESGGIRGEKM